MPSALAQPYTARQLTVATSGLLLVEVDPASAALTLNAQLQINTLGQASTLGVAVTLDGTTPLIRELVEIGGRDLALVSFA
jgi:flagellar basal body rod protein FlgF